ncbi:MAG: hypothetical protein EXS32_01110 [Opitutus sp.]|nr:hypothetical protein [Opitutus sp.]
MPAALRLTRPALATLVLSAAGLALALAGRAGAQTPLAKDSPFLPGASQAVAVAANENFELTAVTTVGKKTYVNLLDSQAKKSRWIAVGETVDGLAVLTYDAKREQAVTRIGGVEKLLTLRQPKGVVYSTVPNVNAAMNFAIPTPPVSPPDTATTPAVDPAKPATPVVAPTIARQEEEARMLVSDLLEIGMAQRKAYEEAQKKAAEPGGQTPRPADKD